MQAVILAGGEGSRLRPLTRSRPKALIPVANRPILDYVIEAVTSAGIQDITVVVGYRKEQVLKYLNSLETEVTTVVQKNNWERRMHYYVPRTMLTVRFLFFPETIISALSQCRK